jgi:asparagine synthase (glutamine-hydrolysing)
MTGLCGWLGAGGGDPVAVIEGMRARIASGETPTTAALARSDFGLAAAGPDGTAGVFDLGTIKIAVHGHPHWSDGPDRALAPEAFCRRLVAAYRATGREALASVGGDFALALIDTERGEALLAVDRSGIRNLVYRVERGVLVFAANLDALATHPVVSLRVDPQALYDYVYFHMVPGPETIYTGARRLLAGECALARGGEVSLHRYWEMRFVEDRVSTVRRLAPEFRGALRAGVAALAHDRSCGAFLSGGTDSSTVAGVLSELRGGPVKTFSIGFDAAGYDEMTYARIAARHFGTEHHEYYVTPADVADALPRIAAAYDQPFGNASAVPTYYCARLARSAGVARMLAGDGGDELFGGNERYAKQHRLALYQRLPAPMRERLIEPLLLRGRAARGLPLLRKGRRYVEQARLPMPARYETYNLLEQLGPESVFDAEFLASIDRGRPLALLGAVHHGAHARSLINRMLALDLKFTLADNDLPKVTRMCDLAEVDVAFPLLHESVVAFSALLAPDLKLRGARLRYFFKEALRGFLPREIIAKRKHGFGLPAGVWLESYAPLRALAGDALAGLAGRGIIRRRFLDELLNRRLREHPAYYGTMVWVLMMLELWFRAHAQRR